MNQRRWLWIAVCVLLFAVGCGGTKTEKGPEASACPALDTLLEAVAKLEAQLNAAPWAECEAALAGTLTRLEQNIRENDQICHFLNQKQRPELSRFAFVDALRGRIERDTVADGIYFLIRLRGIFSADPAISEYFSEELAYVATANPKCYLDYLRDNPDQERMLLHSTKWNPLLLDDLIAGFQPLSGAAGILDFLQQLKDDQSP